MEGFDVLDVAEDGFLLGGDVSGRVGVASVLHVVRGEELHVLHKLCLAAHQVLDQLPEWWGERPHSLVRKPYREVLQI